MANIIFIFVLKRRTRKALNKSRLRPKSMFIGLFEFLLLFNSKCAEYMELKFAGVHSQMKIKRPTSKSLSLSIFPTHSPANLYDE